MWVKCTTGIKNSGVFTYKKVYEVKFIDSNIMIITADNGKDVEIEKCTHAGKKGELSFYQPVGVFSWFAFEEVEKPKYATSPEVLAQVFRKMADNILAGLPPKEGIQQQGAGYVWRAETADTFMIATQGIYRVKPETITLKNGVEIPKPLDISDVSRGIRYYKVSDSVFLYCSASADEITYGKFKFIYKTKEEAIEASKALFGLEIKDV